MDIMKWTYDDKTVRTAETADGKVLFCGKDVAEALGYTNPRDALAKHCKGVAKCDTLTNGGKQELSFIPGERGGETNEFRESLYYATGKRDPDSQTGAAAARSRT